MDELDQEFQAWLQVAVDGDGQLALEIDPTGQHASVYLWRVADAARDFVQWEPPKPARQHHRAFSLCLEARAAAAEAFREAADRAGVVNPAGKIGEANRSLADAEDEQDRAREALVDIERKLASA
jgi:hypothetical protein